MPPITSELRDSKYETATQAQRYFYSSVESGLELQRIFSHYNLDENLYTPYALTVGDVILGFFSLNDLPNLLKGIPGISFEIAINLAKDLQDYLSPLRPYNETQTTDTHDHSMIADIAETEAVIEKLPTFRTMARDMRDLESQAPDEGVAHRSSQDHVLSGNKNSPAEAAPDPALRWGSEK